MLADTIYLELAELEAEEAADDLTLLADDDDAEEDCAFLSTPRVPRWMRGARELETLLQSILRLMCSPVGRVKPEASCLTMWRGAANVVGTSSARPMPAAVRERNFFIIKNRVRKQLKVF